eukprot:2565901-Pyramimonas_sp.AAC.1
MACASNILRLSFGSMAAMAAARRARAAPSNACTPRGTTSPREVAMPAASLSATWPATWPSTRRHACAHLPGERARQGRASRTSAEQPNKVLSQPTCGPISPHLRSYLNPPEVLFHPTCGPISTHLRSYLNPPELLSQPT